MTLVQLRHFLDLASTGSFSKSAEKLFLTQPALSRSIKSLEDELGQALFDRVGRKNELTAFGKHILLQAKDLLEAARSLKHSSQELLSGQTGQVKLGLGSGPGALWMTPLLTHMATDFPNARLEIARGATPLLVQQLREGGDDGRPIAAIAPESETGKIFHDMARKIAADNKPRKKFSKFLKVNG
jgi:DNA-binding transcriptional LysR family regulator